LTDPIVTLVTLPESFTQSGGGKVEKYPNIALKLFQRGWVTVPANGKRCLIKGWQHYGKKPFITENDIREFSTKHAQSKFGTNTSHVFGPDSPLVAIDIDISDHATTKRVAIAAWNILGSTPLVRVGKSPKCALFYRKASSEYDQPKKEFEQKILQPRGTPVEVFATSGQMVWFGIHPETQRPYSWLRYSPLDLSPNEVPILEPDCLHRFLSQLPKCHRDASNRVSKPIKDLTTRLRDERSRALNPQHYLEIVDNQLAKMKSKRENNGQGTRTLTMISVAYALTKKGMSETQILDLFGKHFERWPKEKRSLVRRATIAIKSARKKQNQIKRH